MPPVIHAGMPDNIVFYRQFGDGDVEGAFSRANLVLDKTFHFPRQTGVPIEGRGVVANYDRGQERLTLWASCRSPHLVKTTVSNVMRLPQHAVRVISGDVGGEFGIKRRGVPRIGHPFFSFPQGGPAGQMGGRPDGKPDGVRTRP